MIDRWSSGWRLCALAALLALVYLGIALHDGLSLSAEGAVREGICRQMMSNQTAGRQGLVSSCWWGPLPTLSLLPAMFLLGGEPTGLAAIATSALCGAAMLLLLERGLRRRGAESWRVALVAAVGLDPMFVRECLTGTSTPLAGVLLVAATDGLAAWFESRQLRRLVWGGLALAGLLASGFDLWPWAVMAVVVLVTAEMRRPHEPGERRAVLIIGLLPSVYVLGLWVLLCWLIMGDPLYLMRSLAVRGSGPGREFAMPVRLALGYGVIMAIAAAAALAALCRRQRGEVPLALLALALPAAAGMLAWRGWLWAPAPLLVSMPALVALSVSRVLAGRRGATVAGWALTLAALTVCAGLVWRSLPGRERPAVAAPVDIATAWIQALDRHVHERSRFAKVFVCGYEGFAVPGGGQVSSTFVNALDFNFDKAKRDYYGHALFVLVRRPDQRSAMDSVHWKFPRIFIRGGPDTLYDSDWGEWRLFEMIQAPRTR